MSHLSLRVLRLYLIYSFFLALFLGTFTIYRRIVLGEYNITYLHYGYSIVEALILTKIILIGQSLRLGERLFQEKPLLYPVLYKTAIFTFFMFLMNVFEEFLIGFFKHKSFSQMYATFIHSSINEILARMLILCFFFACFFSFIETARVLGNDKLRNLFLRGTNN